MSYSLIKGLWSLCEHGFTRGAGGRGRLVHLLDKRDRDRRCTTWKRPLKFEARKKVLRRAGAVLPDGTDNVGTRVDIGGFVKSCRVENNAVYLIEWLLFCEFFVKLAGPGGELNPTKHFNNKANPVSGGKEQKK